MSNAVGYGELRFSFADDTHASGISLHNTDESI